MVQLLNETGSLRPCYLKLADNSILPAMGNDYSWMGQQFQCLDMGDAELLVSAYDPDDQSELVAVAGLQKRNGLIAQSLDNGFLFSGTPLLGAADSDKNPLSVLMYAVGEQAGVKAVRFSKVPADGRFMQLVKDYCKAENACLEVLQQYERASLVCDQSYDEWLTSSVSSRHRAEYRRLRRRLSEQGKLEMQIWSGSDQVLQWIDEFIALEAAGWKGRRGTAIAANPSHVKFIQNSLSQLAERGMLKFWRLSLDGRVIASMFGFASGQQGWMGKIAHDESLSKYSPGVLLSLDLTRDWLSSGEVKIVDSCAEPGFVMIERIWRDRLAMADILLSVPDCSKASFNRTRMVETARLKMRKTARKIVRKLR